ncbi:hypothetical protein C8J56DRAFT_830197 [Mycena floridula]|nr:hypothetical protein C8J56DRAFT_830197 [Mycena floridula]
MESLNLNTLARSLPSAQTEKELLDNFKAAAHSITTLYRSSRDASKQSYNAGYTAACQDLLAMIQHGASSSSASSPSPSPVGTSDSEEMTVDKVVSWIEARLDAVRSREEEENEDAEREKEHERPNDKVSTKKDEPKSTEKTTAVSYPVMPSPSPTSSPPTLHSPLPYLEPQPFPSIPLIAAGTKRRHAAMVAASSSTAGGPLPVSTPRRRMRSSRGHYSHSHYQNQNQEPMEVEDDRRGADTLAKRRRF